MQRLRFLFRVVAIVAVFCISPSAFAAQPTVGSPVADKPANVKVDRTTAVMVEHEGTDTLGAKLAFQLKGTFNASSLFTLTEKDAPKLKVLLSTAEEFPSRPNIASIYSLTWAFSQGEGTLSFLLAREVGLITAEELDALILKIAERTDGIAAKYSYLFSK
ncbi:hypothetical protein LJC26_01330 [Desulfovibrio sp. OttesenSCG-928-O18]|nr:hypothetical protein [Desulfovibrio sp. OttesenSCG-928-O18]